METWTGAAAQWAMTNGCGHMKVIMPIRLTPKPHVRPHSGAKFAYAGAHMSPRRLAEVGRASLAGWNCPDVKSLGANRIGRVSSRWRWRKLRHDHGSPSSRPAQDSWPSVRSPWSAVHGAKEKGAALPAHNPFDCLGRPTDTRRAAEGNTRRSGMGRSQAQPFGALLVPHIAF